MTELPSRGLGVPTTNIRLRPATAKEDYSRVLVDLQTKGHRKFIPEGLDHNVLRYVVACGRAQPWRLPVKGADPKLAVSSNSVRGECDKHVFVG
jgi:hypothetical protein